MVFWKAGGGLFLYHGGGGKEITRNQDDPFTVRILGKFHLRKNSQTPRSFYTGAYIEQKSKIHDKNSTRTAAPPIRFLKLGFVETPWNSS